MNFVFPRYGRALLGCAREEAKLLDITETAPNEDSENEVEASMYKLALCY